MNIIDRIKLGAQIMRGGVKGLADLQPVWKTTEASYMDIQYENAVKFGFRKNELIYSCINKTAITGSQIHLTAIDKTTEKEIGAHPLTDLIQAPNDLMNEADFWAAVTVFQKLAGWAVFEKERNNGGDVIGLHPLRPDWIAPERSERTGKLTHYSYTVPGMKPIDLRIQDVLIFRLFDPMNKYKGWPPVAVAARVGDVDNSQTDFLKLFFEGGGVPYGYIKTTAKLSDTNAKSIRNRFAEQYQGSRNWNKPLVLDQDADYKKMGLSFEEMGFEVLDARSEARICSVLDVPPIIIGAKVGLDRSTYSNYEQARAAWWEDSLVPMYKNYLDAVTHQLLPEFTDTENLDFKWDISKVPALQPNMDKRWERANTAWNSGAITRNQFLKEIGEDEIGSAGEVYLMPFSAVLLPAKADPATLMDMGQDTEDELEEGKSLKALQDAPDDDLRRKDERGLKKDLDVYFAGLMDRLEKGLEGSGFKAGDVEQDQGNFPALVDEDGNRVQIIPADEEIEVAQPEDEDPDE